MSHTLSLALIFLLLTNWTPTIYGAATVQSEVGAIPAGLGIEVHLKDKQKLRGVLGAVSDSAFTLVEPRTGDRQILFADVTSVRRSNGNSHLTRNILIGTAIGVATLGIIVGVELRCGPLGCRSRSGL